jgi:L-ribulose-5-phosphate 3-epimerase
MGTKNKIGVLQGRLTASEGRGIQFFPFENWQNEFQIAREIGFDVIELLVKKDSFKDNPIWSAGGRNEIQKLKEKHMIETPSVHGFTLKTPDYPEIFSELIKYASSLGAKTVLASFFDENVLDCEEAKRQAGERLKGPVITAEELGVKIGIETEMKAEELRDFVESFESDSVGVYYDIGNMVSMNADVPKEITHLGDLICGVHIKDRLKNNGPSVEIGAGDSDFESIVAALKQIGYMGALVMQGARKDGVDDIKLNRQYHKFIKNIL